MSQDSFTKLWKTQKSLTEWLEDIQHSDVAAIRKEDNEKRERLQVLNNSIGLPFDKPTKFAATALAEKTPEFVAFLKERGDELCALRLIPTEDGLPKLRMRGKSIADAYKWFLEQNLDASKYRADFVPHTDEGGWGTIFVVNAHGIQGEIILGGHHQLTQGFHEGNVPLVFRYDFNEWTIAPHNDDALAHLQKLAKFLYVPDKAKQKELRQKLGSTFIHDYLEGYFETTDSSLGTWFIDYSRAIGDLYADTVINPALSKESTGLTGQTGSPGKAQGKVVIVSPDNMDILFEEGSVLVCAVTTPDYVPLMQKAAAIVTDQGGILSHAAIVARELKKPCIVGTARATEVLKDGQMVMVDADKGTVE
jgi:phosphohistidine swiveling domain-containing protein